MKRLGTICLSLLLVAALSLASYWVTAHHASSLSYDQLSFDHFEVGDGSIELRVLPKLDGMYLYSASVSQDGEELRLIIRGGKNGALAQTPNERTATFTVDVPQGVKRIVCGKSTVYTF